jgi:hypothetical protein
MALTPQFRRAQAVRCRYLAREAQMLASRLPGDPFARRLIEFSAEDCGCNGIWSAAHGPTVTLAIGVSP